jgi:Ankyrin repeats (3 copies)/Matrixin
MAKRCFLASIIALWPWTIALGAPADLLGSRTQQQITFDENAAHAWPKQSFPLKVYIEAVPEGAKDHVQDYRKAVLSAMKAWNDVGIEGTPPFVLTEDRDLANVTVGWQLELDAKRGGVEQSRLAYRKGFPYQASIGSSVTLMIQHYKRHSYPTGLLGFFLPVPIPNITTEGVEQRSSDEVNLIAIHELGHSLGLPHNDDKSDIMYPVEGESFVLLGFEFNNPPSLTDRSKRNLAEHYRLAWQAFTESPPRLPPPPRPKPVVAQLSPLPAPASPVTTGATDLLPQPTKYRSDSSPRSITPSPPEPASVPERLLPPATPDLLLAAEKGATKDVERFLAQGIDVNTRDDNGWTALIAASSQGKADTVAFLLQHGADANIRDFDGYTALRHAKANGYKKVVVILEQAGAKE